MEYFPVLTPLQPCSEVKWKRKPVELQTVLAEAFEINPLFPHTCSQVGAPIPGAFYFSQTRPDCPANTTRLMS